MGNSPRNDIIDDSGRLQFFLFRFLKHVRELLSRQTRQTRIQRQALETSHRNFIAGLLDRRTEPPFISCAFHREYLTPASLAYLQVIHTRGSFELQVSQVLYDERVVNRLAVLSCELELEAARRGVRARLAGVAADDNVVEFEDCLDAALPFVAGQDAELNVIEVVERFTGTDEPRGRLVKAESVDRLNWKIAEENLSGNLVSGNSIRERPEALELMIRTQCHRK